MAAPGPAYYEPGLYWWVRDDDETGMSGTGRVAQACVFEDQSAVMRWLKTRNAAGIGSTVVYASVHDLVWVHGHGDKRTGRLERVVPKRVERGARCPGGHRLSGELDHCGQVWCDPCGALVTPR